MPDAPDNKPIVHRRGPDGRMEVGPGWESLIDRQIREAMESGEFDNLPFQGEPLPDDGNPYAGDKALAFHLLKGQGYAPPWIESDKEVRDLLARRDAILERAATGPAPSALAMARGRADLQDLVVRINAAVARVNAEAPSERQHRRPLTVADELSRYDEACRR